MGVRSATRLRSPNREVSPRWYTVVPPIPITTPAARPITCPSGSVLVWKAGTSFTQPHSSSTVPPRFGSATSSIPWAESHRASSTIATHVAPVRFATSTTCAMWSAWPWVSRMCVGSTSSAPTTAAGLSGLRKGSIRIRAEPSAISNAAWPRKRICTGPSDLLHLRVAAVEVALEEVDRAIPGALGVLGVVGAQAVMVGKERVPGAFVEVEDRFRPGLVQLLLQRLGVVDADEVVALPEVAQDGLAGELREVRLAVRHHVVERDRGADLVVHRRGPDREPAAQAEAHSPDLAGALRVGGEVVHRSAHLLLGLLHVQRHHLLLRLVRLFRGLAVEEVGRQGDEPLPREAVAHVADVIVDTPPLLQNDDPGALALGLRQVSRRRAAVGLELHYRHLVLLLLR